MKHIIKFVVLNILIFFLQSYGQDIAHRHVTSNQQKILVIGQHFGRITMTQAHHFETVLKADSLYIYGYDGDFKAISLKGTSGTVKLLYQDEIQVTKDLIFQPKTKKNKSDYLLAVFNLKTVEGIDEGDLYALVNIEGLLNEQETSIEFTIPVTDSQVNNDKTVEINDK